MHPWRSEVTFFLSLLFPLSSLLSGTDRATCNLPGECICNDPSYSGSLCQIDNDVCGHVAPCQNGATCTNMGPDAYSCTCPPGYTGTNCDINIDECGSTPCQNGGTCTVRTRMWGWGIKTSIFQAWVKVFIIYSGYASYLEVVCSVLYSCFCGQLH